MIGPRVLAVVAFIVAVVLFVVAAVDSSASPRVLDWGDVSLAGGLLLIALDPVWPRGPRTPA